MLSKPRTFLAALGLASVMAAAAWAQTGGAKKAAGKAPSAAADTKALSVNELAAKPSAYIGRVALVGVVASTNNKKGFVLIDTKEYTGCGLTCVTEPGTKKIPIRWSGAAPKVKQTVRVEGTLAKGQKGFALTARKVGRL